MIKFYQFNFVDSFSVNYDRICFLHHFVFIFLMSILIFVIYILMIVLNPNWKLNLMKYKFLKYFYIRYIFYKSNKFMHESNLELIWTLIPTLIICILILPSFDLLYTITESYVTDFMVKVVGHQWYWSYEYTTWFPRDSYLMNYLLLDSDKLSGKMYIVAAFMTFLSKFYNDTFIVHFKFDSNLVYHDVLSLLYVDNLLVIPMNKSMKFLVTSDDVIHSFAVPSLGIKMDAIPGSISDVNIKMKSEGFFVGQCSEICGMNHGYMPMNILGMVYEDFSNFICSMLRDYLQKHQK